MTLTDTQASGFRRAALSGAFAGGLALAVGLSGCNQYLDESDKIAMGVGDSVAANKAIHTINPWPHAATRTSQTTDGERLKKAIENYHTNKAANDNSSTGTTTSSSAP